MDIVKRIIRLRGDPPNRPLSYVGKVVGFSRQNVHLILQKHRPDLAKGKVVTLKTQLLKLCESCGVEMDITYKPKQKYHSKKCFGKTLKINPYELGDPKYNKWRNKKYKERANDV